MLQVQLDEEFKALVAAAVRDALQVLPAANCSWKERLWVVPPDTRLGVSEVCAATGRSKQCVYRWSRLKALPFKKLDGVLSVRAADLRRFITEREEAA